jgi:uncharacterized protein YcbX
MTGSVADVPTVTGFNVTPVKSTALHNPEEIRLERHGASGNREFFFLDEHDHLFGGSKLGSLVQLRASYDRETDVLAITFPSGIEVEGPAAGTGEPLVVDFWGRSVEARAVNGPWTEPLASFAGRPLRLARVVRPGDGNDVRAVTLVSLASVEELSRQGGREAPVDARRFRMTIELDGCRPHEEDTWRGQRLRVGDAMLEVEDPVPRCVVTTQDPETGLRDFPTLSVIKRYRGATDGELLFGVYASVIEPGTVRRGDEVTLL